MLPKIDHKIDNPNITLFVIGKQEINQEYDNIKVIRLQEGANFSKTFNSEREKFKEDGLYGYLLPYHNFASTSSINMIIKRLSENQNIFGVYTDNIDNTNINRYYPAYDPDVFMKKNIIINVPLFTKQLLTFDETIEHLLFYDILRNCSSKIIWYHEASPLISTINCQFNPMNDLRIIKEKQ